MLNGKKIIVVLPAYNAAKTLEKTCRSIPRDIVDEVILVDDSSQDHTIEIARRLHIPYYRHSANRGYGANQKTCYQAALNRGADIVVMLHPDYQYPPELIPVLVRPIAFGACHAVLGSRVMDGGAVRRGMPRYKYVSNRIWTFGQNICIGQRLSEYHTGFRAFSRELLLAIPLLENSDDFVFDNQVLVQTIYFGYIIKEISVPARFSADSSSINAWRGTWYGLGVVMATLQYLLQRSRLFRFRMFNQSGRRLTSPKETGSVAGGSSSGVIELS